MRGSNTSSLCAAAGVVAQVPHLLSRRAKQQCEVQHPVIQQCVGAHLGVGVHMQYGRLRRRLRNSTCRRCCGVARGKEGLGVVHSWQSPQARQRRPPCHAWVQSAWSDCIAAHAAAHRCLPGARGRPRALTFIMRIIWRHCPATSASRSPRTKPRHLALATAAAATLAAASRSTSAPPASARASPLGAASAASSASIGAGSISQARTAEGACPPGGAPAGPAGASAALGAAGSSTL